MGGGFGCGRRSSSNGDEHNGARWVGGYGV